MVETTHAFVKLKQIKAAVSAGGIKFAHNEQTSDKILALNGAALNRAHGQMLQIIHGKKRRIEIVTRGRS